MSESDGEMLQRLGIDGHAWAVEYCKRFGEQHPDLETIHGWFANAIMAGADYEGRKLAALRAALEKIEAEMRAEADHAHNALPAHDVGWHVVKMWADAIRKALGEGT